MSRSTGNDTATGSSAEVADEVVLALGLAVALHPQPLAVVAGFGLVLLGRGLLEAGLND